MGNNWKSKAFSTCLLVLGLGGRGNKNGRGNDNPFQYSCLENPMDRGVWWAAVHGGNKTSDVTDVT